MSLQTTLNRNTQEAVKIYTEKQTDKTIKEGILRQAIRDAILEELKTKSVADLMNDNKDDKANILQNVCDQLNNEDFFENQKECNALCFKSLKIYDSELKNIISKRAKIEKIEKQKQKEIEKQQQEAEKLQAEKLANRQLAIDTFFKVIGVIGLILLAPLIFIIFIIFEALKNTK